MIELSISGAKVQINIDWDKMLRIIELTSMENSLNKQYQNANNVSARIELHKLYSTNKQGWFPWLFSQMNLKSGMKILEVGCGSGALWTENLDSIPVGKGTEIVLSDISGGMLQDAARGILGDYTRKKEKRLCLRSCRCSRLTLRLFTKLSKAAP